MSWFSSRLICGGPARPPAISLPSLAHVTLSPRPRASPTVHVTSSPCPRTCPAVHIIFSPRSRACPTAHAASSPCPRACPIVHVSPRLGRAPALSPRLHCGEAGGWRAAAGFVAGVGRELLTGETIWAQLARNPFAYLLAYGIVVGASFINRCCSPLLPPLVPVQELRFLLLALLLEPLTTVPSLVNVCCFPLLPSPSTIQ